MSRYLVEILEIRIQRKIVLAFNYESAKDFALRNVNLRAQSAVNETIDAKVIKVLPEVSSRFEMFTQEKEEVELNLEEKPHNAK